MIEENFYGPILRRDPTSPEALWGNLVADDLLRPKFKMGRLQAMRARLLRNYWPIFTVILCAWVLKVTAHPAPAKSWADIMDHLEVGILPWWLPLAFVSIFLGAMLALVLLKPQSRKTEEVYGKDFNG